MTSPARIGWLALLALLALAPPAWAQTPAPTVTDAAPADVPAGDARIHGRVLHAVTGAPVAGVEVVLYALAARGPGLRRGESDAEGRFAFEGVSRDGDTTYLVGARFAGVPFPGGRISFAAGESDKQVDVRVAEPTQDPSGIGTLETRIQLDAIAGRLTVSEQHRLANDAGVPYYVPEAARTPARAALRTRLPAGAGDLGAPLGVVPEGLVRDDDGLAFFGPVYGGAQELSFFYTLPAGAGRLVVERAFDSGSQQVSVFVPTAGVEFDALDLGPGEAADVEGRAYTRYDVGPVAPGGAVRFALDRPETRDAPGAVAIDRARLVLEFDEATLLVSEHYEIRVDGAQHVQAQGAEPLLRIPLPAGAELTGLSDAAGSQGLVPDGDGGIAVRGPLPPGESAIDFGYRLAVGGTRVALDRPFASRVPLLSVFVGDTGVLAASDRLHRRRPVRSNGRSYMQLEGFEIGAGESVSLALQTIPLHGGGLSRSAALGLVLAFTALAVWFVAAPLRRSGPAAPAVVEESDALGEREALVAAIHDLDHDHETGKLSEDDYASLRDELRRRAALQLQAERAAEKAASAATAAADGPRFCASCGEGLTSAARFCAQCGAKVERSD